MYQRFKDREDAALKLIPLLDKYRKQPCVVMAVPRGGVPLAAVIANYFHFPLELLMSKKIAHPNYPEFAIGAVSLKNHVLDEINNISDSYINQEIQRIRISLREKYKKFTGNHSPPGLKNKILLIVDDGIATGNTILASIEMLRQQHPKKIIVAVPVIAADSVKKISNETDELVCIYEPKHFGSVGNYYNNFEQVSDEEVIRKLKESDSMEKAV
jgi:predicted phosphoribosyltransferase